VFVRQRFLVSVTLKVGPRSVRQRLHLESLYCQVLEAPIAGEGRKKIAVSPGMSSECHSRPLVNR
jgi:hypothetical protein